MRLRLKRVKLFTKTATNGSGPTSHRAVARLGSPALPPYAISAIASGTCRPAEGRKRGCRRRTGPAIRRGDPSLCSLPAHRPPPSRLGRFAGHLPVGPGELLFAFIDGRIAAGRFAAIDGPPGRNGSSQTLRRCKKAGRLAATGLSRRDPRPGSAELAPAGGAATRRTWLPSEKSLTPFARN